MIPLEELPKLCQLLMSKRTYMKLAFWNNFFDPNLIMEDLILVQKSTLQASRCSILGISCFIDNKLPLGHIVMAHRQKLTEQVLDLSHVIS